MLRSYLKPCGSGVDSIAWRALANRFVLEHSQKASYSTNSEEPSQALKQQKQQQPPPAKPPRSNPVSKTTLETNAPYSLDVLKPTKQMPDSNTWFDSRGNPSSPIEPLKAEENPYRTNESFMIQHLFDANVHVGHSVGALNPKMSHFIHGTRAGVHIIDLHQTIAALRRTIAVVREIAARKGVILFLSSHKGTKDYVVDEAHRCGQYFHTETWRAGTFTNIRTTLKHTRFPDLVIFFYPSKSLLPLRETTQCKIPSIGICDTNFDPEQFTYVVPGNDEGIAAQKVYITLFANAALEGARRSTKSKPEEPLKNAVDV